MGQAAEKAIEDIKSYMLFGYWNIPMKKLINEGWFNKNQKENFLSILPEEVPEST